MQLRPGTFLQNRYEIFGQIGSGGMSVVYKAKCHKLNRLVAIKVLKEEFSQDSNFVYKFKIEAQSAAGLSHPNIVNVYDVVDEEELHYIVMEYIEGITLKSYIKSKGRLDIKEALNISIKVASGIKAAHDADIIHRDIKPQNIIIAKDGAIKVADFGIARAVSEQTLSAVGIGSVHYMSPEQAKGARCDKRSDIYSLGISMYEMLTGRLPFEGDVTVTVALAHLEEKMPEPSLYNDRISPELDNIILTCTRKSPDRRYFDLSELIMDLESLLADYNFENTRVAPAGADGTRIISASELNAINSQSRKREEKEPPRKKRKSGQEKLREKEADKETEENPRLDRMISFLGVVIALVIVAFIGFFLAGRFKLFEFAATTRTVQTSESSSGLASTQVRTPDVVDMGEEFAEKRLKESDLQMKVVSSAYSDSIEKGNIISQSPAAGEVINRYSNVEVVVSKGSDKIDLTSLGLENKRRETAIRLLEEQGFFVILLEENSDTILADYVLRYEPTTAKRGSNITLYISKGKKEETVILPNFVHYTRQDALKAIADLGLTAGEIKEEYSADYAKDLVMAQSIEANTQVVKGSSIDLTVSLGRMPESSKTYKYIASIDTTYDIEDLIGPGSSAVNVSIMVRLRQTVNGEAVYTTLMEPREVSGNTILPVRFKSIEGAYGVDQGYVEVVEASSQTVLKSFEVEFFKVE